VCNGVRTAYNESLGGGGGYYCSMPFYTRYFLLAWLFVCLLVTGRYIPFVVCNFDFPPRHLKN
jgi:hypothetical protein